MKKILLVVVILLVGFGIYVNAQSDVMDVSRSVTIAAPAAQIFPYVNNFKKFNEWQPWSTNLDPNAQFTFAGPDSGEGASFSWKGNSKIGEGTDTIIKSVPHELVEVKLEFIKPFKATNTAKFMLSPQDTGTQVTWNVQGKKNFVSKAMGVFIDCDKMLGDQFDQGLTQLKDLVEKAG